MTRELGDWVRISWSSAVEMHICFYEAWCTRDDVEGALPLIERLMLEIRKAITQND